MTLHAFPPPGTADTRLAYPHLITAGLLMLAGIITILLWARPTEPRIESAVITDIDGRAVQTPVKLPYTHSAPNSKTLAFDIRLRFATGDSPYFKLIPDDCITSFVVNDKNALHAIPEYLRCNYLHGLRLDMGHYLHEGDNRIQIGIANRGGPTGLQFIPDALSTFHRYLYLSVGWLTLVLLAAAITRCFGHDPVTMAAFSFTWLIYLLQFHGTNPWHFSHDYGAHVGYLQAIGANWTIPPPANHIQKHNPFYYIVCAAIYRLSAWAGLNNPLDAVRYLSQFLFFGFTLLGVLALRQFFSRSLYYYTALAIFLAWPRGLALPGHINDDIAIYCFAAGLFYCLTLWEKSHNNRHLAMALLCCVYLILTKGGALLYLTILGLTVAWHIRYRNAAASSLLDWRIIAPLLLAALAAAGNYLRFYLQDTQEMTWHIYTTGPWKNNYNHIWNFIGMDWWPLIATPLTSTQETAQYFWNAFFRTLLFGEWPAWRMAPVATAISVTFLCMLMYAVFSMAYFVCRRPVPRNGSLLLPLITLLLSIGALMYFRYRYPMMSSVAPTNDARYIYYIILPISILLAKTAQWHDADGRHRLALTGITMAGLFAACALLFQAGNAIRLFAISLS